MIENPYEKHADVYLEFVDKALADERSLLRLLLSTFERLLRGRIDGARVLDVACGEGYLARHLAQLGPRHIVGVDSSPALIQEAQRRNKSTGVSFQVDDAEALASLSDASFDVAVSQMALMDVADHAAMFRAVRSVLEHPGETLRWSGNSSPTSSWRVYGCQCVGFLGSSPSPGH